ncbi:MAG: bacterioferritin [Candidatus Latescibacterota bacterium]
MRGDERVLATLNTLLADELTAINQYMVQSEMSANWGYERLHQAIEKEARDEMKHAERLIGRLLFLEGVPVVGRLNAIHVGSTVPEFFAHNLAAESGAVAGYNAGIRLCVEAGDNGTRELLESILQDEEAHVDWLEAQQAQIEQMGLGQYLTEQIG